MVDNLILLKDIRYNSTTELIITWQHINANDECCIYFKQLTSDLEPKDKKLGFYFCAVLLSGEEYRHGWDKPEQLAEIIYQGVAYWDGIRHLYMGSEQTDNYGYHYYPDVNNHIAVLNALKELEKQYCSEHA